MTSSACFPCKAVAMQVESQALVQMDGIETAPAVVHVSPDCNPVVVNAYLAGEDSWFCKIEHGTCQLPNAYTIRIMISVLFHPSDGSHSVFLANFQAHTVSTHLLGSFSKSSPPKKKLVGIIPSNLVFG